MKKIIIAAVAASLMLAGCGSGSQEASQKTDDAITTIMNRKSVRSYTGEKLSQEQIETLLKAAMAAPTAMNSQPWRFVVLTDPDVIGDVFANERGEMYKQAGAVFIVCGHHEHGHGINGLHYAKIFLHSGPILSFRPLPFRHKYDIIKPFQNTSTNIFVRYLLGGKHEQN